jgi:serine/threonine-protein kinase
LLQTKKNNNIIKHVDFIVAENYWCEICEFFDGCNLKEYINTHDMNIDDIIYIFFQIVEGIKFLHENNIIHCDIKLQNIMINNNKKIKIIDFDLSKIVDDYFVCDYIFGTCEYLSPESYDLCIHSKKSDIWELGILLYYLITKEFPYKNDDIRSSNSYEHLYRRNKFKYPNMEKIFNVVKEKKLPDSIYVLILKLLNFKDYNRPTIDEILDFISSNYIIKLQQ